MSYLEIEIELTEMYMNWHGFLGYWRYQGKRWKLEISRLFGENLLDVVLRLSFSPSKLSTDSLVLKSCPIYI
jgi:hypothetical protein